MWLRGERISQVCFEEYNYWISNVSFVRAAGTIKRILGSAWWVWPGFTNQAPPPLRSIDKAFPHSDRSMDSIHLPPPLGQSVELSILYLPGERSHGEPSICGIFFLLQNPLTCWGISHAFLAARSRDPALLSSKNWGDSTFFISRCLMEDLSIFVRSSPAVRFIGLFIVLGKSRILFFRLWSREPSVEMPSKQKTAWK